jgi:3-oxoacyl-[acyl-carrier-protein] synthase II
MRRVVVTGLGAVSPIGNTPEHIWQALCACHSGLAPLKLSCAPSLPIAVAGQIQNFSPREFNIPVKSLKVMNKTIQYALAASSRAVADAGIRNVYAPAEIGIYLGVNGIQYTAEELFLASYEAVGRDMRSYMNHEYRSTGEAVTFRDPDAAVHPLWPLSVLANMALCHIAIQHNFQGTNLAFSSIDAAGSQAIGEAFHTIRQGRAEVIVAGGSYALNTLDLLSLIGSGVLAPGDAACRPFDRNRAGCVAGEGAVLLVLEERTRALKRGARIYAEIVGYGSWCDTTGVLPHEGSSQNAHEPLCCCMEQALQDASCEPAAISCIAADGKSTPEHDRREAQAYGYLFGQYGATIPISSPTPLTGYLFSANGALNALTALLSLIHGMVPPLANHDAPDPDCALLFPKKTLKKNVAYAMANTFGFLGEHTTLIFHHTGNA